jgi:hypothetical protein
MYFEIALALGMTKGEMLARMSSSYELSQWMEFLPMRAKRIRDAQEQG